MSDVSWTSVDDMEMFRSLERLIDRIWTNVLRWGPLPRDTVGKQLVRAADSIGANLCEGDARFHHKDNLNYCYISRASLRETSYWLRRAEARNLMSNEDSLQMREELDSTRRWINSLITERRKWLTEVREEQANYDA
ncbi:MAG TPA: four helix bundle protein [Armatimonadota bacterium]|jgi:four helix bundle protein